MSPNAILFLFNTQAAVATKTMLQIKTFYQNYKAKYDLERIHEALTGQPPASRSRKRARTAATSLDALSLPEAPADAPADEANASPADADGAGAGEAFMSEAADASVPGVASPGEAAAPPALSAPAGGNLVLPGGLTAAALHTLAASLSAAAAAGGSVGNVGSNAAAGAASGSGNNTAGVLSLLQTLAGSAASPNARAAADGTQLPVAPIALASAACASPHASPVLALALPIGEHPQPLEAGAKAAPAAQALLEQGSSAGALQHQQAQHPLTAALLGSSGGADLAVHLRDAAAAAMRTGALKLAAAAAAAASLPATGGDTVPVQLVAAGLAEALPAQPLAHSPSATHIAPGIAPLPDAVAADATAVASLAAAQPADPAPGVLLPAARAASPPIAQLELLRATAAAASARGSKRPDSAPASSPPSAKRAKLDDAPPAAAEAAALGLGAPQAPAAAAAAGGAPSQTGASDASAAAAEMGRGGDAMEHDSAPDAAPTSDGDLGSAAAGSEPAMAAAPLQHPDSHGIPPAIVPPAVGGSMARAGPMTALLAGDMDVDIQEPAARVPAATLQPASEPEGAAAAAADAPLLATGSAAHGALSEGAGGDRPAHPEHVS